MDEQQAMESARRGTAQSSMDERGTTPTVRRRNNASWVDEELADIEAARSGDTEAIERLARRAEEDRIQGTLARSAEHEASGHGVTSGLYRMESPEGNTIETRDVERVRQLEAKGWTDNTGALPLPARERMQNIRDELSGNEHLSTRARSTEPTEEVREATIGRNNSESSPRPPPNTRS